MSFSQCERYCETTSSSSRVGATRTQHDCKDQPVEKRLEVAIAALGLAAILAALLYRITLGVDLSDESYYAAFVVNDGILAYIARTAVHGSYGLAFRGTNTDMNVTGSFQNLLNDLEAFNVAP